MGSESEEVLIDSDDSLLDIKELNDLEYDIPQVAAPSLESVLWDMESEEEETASMHSDQSMSTKFRSFMYHCILQGLSAQITSAGERASAGLPTVITNSVKYVAVGTSHGYILAFDSEQKLCWCSHDPSISDQGAVSALSISMDSTRLLVGYERGFISMIDATTGDVIRKLPDAHAPLTAVLHLRFTFLKNLALCGDSSGCVFSLSFSRKLGVRSWDSKCLFSGARGEVCVFEPLTQGQDLYFLTHNILVAMATLSKIIIITIKPRLRVLFSQQLPRISTYLPLLSWQVVPLGKTYQPILAWARGNELNYTRIFTHGTNNRKLRILPLGSVQLPYNTIALHWLGVRHVALLDTSENLRLCEVRTQREPEVLEIASAGLVYASAHFKALALGGGVSEAFALAGERACYNSLSSRGDQLLVLGTKAVHMVKLRSWPERLMYLSEQGRWAEALNLAAEQTFPSHNRENFTTLLLMKYLENLNQNTVDKDSLTAAVNCCIAQDRIDILCEDLWESISGNQVNQNWYLMLLTDHITNGILRNLTPAVTQHLVTYLEDLDPQLLEKVLLNLDISCLDLHQVLNICKKKKLYDAWIHITTKTIHDYASPLTEFLHELTPTNIKLGNTLLVYVSSCLAGLAYPTGKIPAEDIPRAKHDVLRCLETVHSVNGAENEASYPYLRALLKYNTRECLNLIDLAFKEVEFSGEMGLLQRQRLVKILMEIVKAPEFSDCQIIMLACFISRLITTHNLHLEERPLNMVIKSLTDLMTKPLSFREHAEREQAWLDLLNGNHLKHLNFEDQLDMALESRCFRVAEHLYALRSDYANILYCYLNDPIRKSEVFTYIRNYINIDERCIKKQCLVHFKQLVALDSKKTADIIVEHFPNLVDELCDILEDKPDLQYAFISEILSSDVKLLPRIAERYLELLCVRNRNAVCGFIQVGSCRVEEALKITRQHEIHAATALLLEYGGEWMEALELLIEHQMVDNAISLCIRGAEHLDGDGAQSLWLTLLRSKATAQNTSLRQLLHAAAPHVPPAQLLELVSDAHFGDVKLLLQGMLTDYQHDVTMFSTTLDLLGKDLHHSLAKQLCLNGRAISVSNINCRLCQKPLSFSAEADGGHSIAIWWCGHSYHSTCVSASDNGGACPQCRLPAVLLETSKTASSVSRQSNQTQRQYRMRPDLEGHF